MHGIGKNSGDLSSDLAKDFSQPETAYDLLWPTMTTKMWSRLGVLLQSWISPLVVTVGHKKSWLQEIFRWISR